MSMQALCWAIEQEVFSSSQKFVLIALANYASDTNHAYPSVATICKITMQNEKTVRAALVGLAEHGLIEDTGNRYGRTQQTRVYRLKMPENGSLEDSAKTPARLREDSVKTPERLPKTGSKPINPLTFEPVTSKPASPFDSDFSLFWKAYPRKIAKPDALRAYLKARKKVSHESILDALARWVKSDSWTRDGGKFIPYPATWLNREGWADEVPVAVAQKEWKPTGGNF